WLATVAFLLISRGRFSRLNLAVCLFVTIALILPWYLRLPNSLATFRVTSTWRWLGLRPEGFDRTLAVWDIVVRFFSGSSQLWRMRPSESVNMAAVCLFGVVAVIATWRLRLQLFVGGRLLLWLVFGAACLGPLVFDLIAHTYSMVHPRY